MPCPENTFVADLAAVEAFFRDLKQQLKNQTVKGKGCFEFIFPFAEKSSELRRRTKFDGVQRIKGRQSDKVDEAVVEGACLYRAVFQIRRDEHDVFRGNGINFVTHMDLRPRSFVPVTIEKGIVPFEGDAPFIHLHVDLVSDQPDFRCVHPALLCDTFSVRRFHKISLLQELTSFQAKIYIAQIPSVCYIKNISSFCLFCKRQIPKVSNPPDTGI